MILLAPRQEGLQGVPKALLSSALRAYAVVHFRRVRYQSFINALSLPQGGIFDYRNEWNPPHHNHHFGIEADVRIRNLPLPGQKQTLALAAKEIGYYKSKGFFVTLPESEKPITGHIDVVQARNGFIHLLDYKPKARDIDPINGLCVGVCFAHTIARKSVEVRLV
jgi:hypothetical protein